jgi:hypothetical protein
MLPVRSLQASGVLSVFASITIIAFFGLGGAWAWGTANDFFYAVSNLALLPALLALRQFHLDSSPRWGRAIWTVGLVGTLGFSLVSFLQVAVDFRLIDFGRLEPVPGLGPLLLAVLLIPVFDVWLLALGRMLKKRGAGDAVKVAVVGITFLGYPIWAFWMARRAAIWSPPN